MALDLASFSGFSGLVDFNASLAKSSYYQIGGSAKVMVTPKSWADLEIIHRVIHAQKLRYFILGWGSNLLFSDAGFDGMVIRMKQLFTEIETIDSNQLKVGASVGGSTLLRKAQLEGWGGLSCLTGIPGSIGGMVAMNAGTHLGEVKNVCVSVDRINLDDLRLERETVIMSDRSFSYRRNHFLGPGDLVVSAVLKFKPEDAQKVKAEVDELYQRRKQTQPVDFPSCGSVFMNPRESGLHAWQVIDRLGLRGHRVGNAQFAEKHSNFIINLGGARASDVKALIDLAKQRAKDELGIELHQEVKYVE